MLRSLAAIVVLMSFVVHAGPPEWTDIGATPEGWRINLALNKRTKTSKETFTVPVCIDNAEHKRDCQTGRADCGKWTFMDVQAGPSTVGELILKAVCPK